MKTTNYYKLTILFIIIFLFWLFTSAIKPITFLFDKELTTFNLIYGISSVLVLSVGVVKVLPKVFSKDGLKDLNLKTGTTKTKGGCSSCKNKVKK